MLCPGSLLALCALLPLSTGVLAAYEGNVNYRSPSLQHDQLGIDLSIVRARSSQNAKHAKRDDRPYDPSELEFTHGVASGDPYADSVILWTRIAPTEKASDSDAPVTGSVPLYDHDSERWVRKTPFPICVEYRVFKDKDGKDVVDEGEAYTTSDIDWTVKVGLLLSFSRHVLLPLDEMRLTSGVGRGKESAAVHHVLLPLQHLRLGQEQRAREDKDQSR